MPRRTHDKEGYVTSEHYDRCHRKSNPLARRRKPASEKARARREKRVA